MNSNDIVKLELKHRWEDKKEGSGIYEVIDLEFNPFIDGFYSDKQKTMYHGVKTSFGRIVLQLYDRHREFGSPVVLEKGAYLSRYDVRELKDFFSQNQEEIKKFIKEHRKKYKEEQKQRILWVTNKNIDICF